MKFNKLGLIISLSAMIVAISCNIDNEPIPFQNGYDNKDGLYDLYLYDVNTKITTRITSSPDNIEGSYSFSPDSKKILYMDDFGINHMNLDGSENWTLMKSGSSPCYSPDGSKIAFTDDQKLFLINSDGTNKTQICNTDIGLWHPVWSKDGENIACSSDSGLCIVSAEGNLKVFSVFNSGTWYAWSNDSREIFYDKEVSLYSEQIFSYNLMEDKESQVTHDDKFNYSVQCNPVDNEIVFTSSRADYGSDLVISDQDGSNRRVILHQGRISTPHWSPKGDRIVFITEDSDLAVIDRNGENFEIINEIRGACLEPRWSDDGKYILYCRAIFYL
jgi:Tol biopolymer transport system component